MHGLRCTGEAAASPRAPSPSEEVGLVYAVPAPPADAPPPAVEDLSFVWSVGVALVQSAIATALQRVVQLQLRVEAPSQVAAIEAAAHAGHGKGKKAHKGKKGHGHKKDKDKDKEHKRHRRTSDVAGHAGHKAAPPVGVEGAHSTTRRRSSGVTATHPQPHRRLSETHRDAAQHAHAHRRLSETHGEGMHAHVLRRLSETHGEGTNAHAHRRMSETHGEGSQSHAHRRPSETHGEGAHAHAHRRMSETGGHGHGHAPSHASAEGLQPAPRHSVAPPGSPRLLADVEHPMGEADVAVEDDLMRTIMVTTRPLSELYARFPVPGQPDVDVPWEGGSKQACAATDAASALLNQPAARASTTPRNSMMQPLGDKAGTLRSGHVGMKLGTGRMGGTDTLRGDQSLRHRMPTLKTKKSVKTMRRPPR